MIGSLPATAAGLFV